MLDFTLSVLDAGLELLLLVVEFVLKRQEMLIEGDTITEKRFIATSLVLLVNLLIFQELDLSLHSGDLLVKVQDNVVMDDFRLPGLFLSSSQLFDFVGGLLKVGVTFEFLVNDGTSCSLINIIIGRGKLDAASGATSASASSCSAFINQNFKLDIEKLSIADSN